MTNPYDRSNAFVKPDSIEFHYALDGEKGKPALALVNMASHNLTCWEPVMDGLLQQFQILRFDIRGTGKSGWGSDDGFTFSQYADDLSAIMETLGIGKAFVLGVAYGARTAVRFALRHPDKLSALGLFDIALSHPVDQAEQRALAAEARNLLKQAGEPDVEIQKYWRFYENREAARKAHTAHKNEPDLSHNLSHLQQPVLVACGRQDCNLEQARMIAGLIPGSQFHVMQMTGHGSPFFRPQLFVDLVNGFEY